MSTVGVSVSSTPPPLPVPPPLPPRADRRRKVPPPPNVSLQSQSPPLSPSPAPNLTSPIVQAAQDVEHARRLLDVPIVDAGLDDADKEIHKMVREKEVTQLLMRMTDWVEELSSLLQECYKKESELESKLALAQSKSSLPTAHGSNPNELDESSKRPYNAPSVLNGSTIREFGWRAWSKRDNRRTSEDEPSTVNAAVVEDTLTPLPKPQSPRNSGTSLLSSQPTLGTPSTPPPSRFFNFPSLTRASSSSLLSTPLLAEGIPPSKPTQREKDLEQQLKKERDSLQKVMAEKAALEGELETLSQALFEQANKMVSNSNKKLAEIEEELRIAMEEREALQSTLRLIASHNRPSDVIHDSVSDHGSPLDHNFLSTDPSTPRAHSRSSSPASELVFELSPMTPHPNRADDDDDDDDDNADDDADEKEADDDDEAHSQPRMPSSEKEGTEPETESKKEPDGSIYSQPESSHLLGHDEGIKEEPTSTEDDDAGVADNIDVNDGEEKHSFGTGSTSPSPQPLPQDAREEQEPRPSSYLVPDMTPLSPASQYTLESTHQNM